MEDRISKNENKKNYNNKTMFVDLINEIKYWKQIFTKHYLYLIISTLLGSLIGFIYAYIDTPQYTATTRFMLKNEGVGSLFGGQMTGLSSLLGGGQMGTPLERTAEVIASDRIVGRALLRIEKLGDTTDLVINHFIRLNQLRDNWKGDSGLLNVSFSRNDLNLDDLTLNQRRAFKYVKSIIVPEKGLGVVRKSFDKKSGVLDLSCVHQNETFAIILNKMIYSELSDFFIEQMTFSASNNAVVMRHKIDSIENELNVIRKENALLTDQSLGILLQQDKIEIKKLSVKEQMLNIMYAEALKNYEAYQFINQAAIPSLTLIEKPYSPLKKYKRSLKLYTISFAFILSSLMFFIIILYYKIKKYTI
jgi:Chain length determinant protein